MNRRLIRGILLALGAGFVVMALASPSEAVPVFARKYGMNCTMCHSSFPRLNDFGLRYRNNGYQLPGRENEEKTVLESPPPIALRTSAGYNRDNFNTTPSDDVDHMQVNGLDILSAGVLGKNIGYMFVYTPEIKGSTGVVAQDGMIEMASVYVNNIGSRWVNLRIGRYEPAYVAFSTKRQLSVSPVEIYSATFENGVAFTDTQEGVELTGHGRRGFSYAAGVMNGSGTNGPNDSPADFYARVSQVFGAGEGQTAGQRIGWVGIMGRARPDASLSSTGRHDYTRSGFDASLNYRQWNLALQFLRGCDDKALWDAAGDVETRGGFAELTYMPLSTLAGFLRYDVVNTDNAIDRNVVRWTGGARFHPVDNLAFHGEYSRREENDPAGVKNPSENFLTGRVDMAF